MRNLATRKFGLVLACVFGAALVASLAAAQVRLPNPVQAAKDAYEKAKQQQQQ